MPPQRQVSEAPISTPRVLPSVVLVDDDPGIVDSLSELLRAHGFAVEGFTDPTAALARLRGGPTPTVVLSDCLMPELSGAELAEALRVAGIDAPVVLMTGLADPGFCVDTARLSVINKPFQIDDLLAELDALSRPASGVRMRRADSQRPSGEGASRDRSA